ANISRESLGERIREVAVVPVDMGRTLASVKGVELEPMKAWRDRTDGLGQRDGKLHGGDNLAEAASACATLNVMDPKLAAAEAAAELVRDGMVVGLGSGSTAALAVKAIGRRAPRIAGIPTSESTAALARGLGIPLTTLVERPRIS